MVFVANDLKYLNSSVTRACGELLSVIIKLRIMNHVLMLGVDLHIITAKSKNPKEITKHSDNRNNYSKNNQYVGDTVHSCIFHRTIKTVVDIKFTVHRPCSAGEH
jgi:hypothetical protein